MKVLNATFIFALAAVASCCSTAGELPPFRLEVNESDLTFRVVALRAGAKYDRTLTGQSRMAPLGAGLLVRNEKGQLLRTTEYNALQWLSTPPPDPQFVKTERPGQIGAWYSVEALSNGMPERQNPAAWHEIRVSFSLGTCVLTSDWIRVDSATVEKWNKDLDDAIRTSP